MQKSAVSLIASRRNCKSEVSAFTYTLLSEFFGQHQATANCILFRLRNTPFENCSSYAQGLQSAQI